MQRSIRNRYRQGMWGTVRRIPSRRYRMARIDERLYKRSHKHARWTPMPEVLSSPGTTNGTLRSQSFIINSLLEY